MTDRNPEEFIGKRRQDLPTPSIIIDKKKVTKNSLRMQEQVAELGISLRHHVKTHKSTEATRIVLGKNCHNVIVSTLAEARGLAPLIADGTVRDITFGLPVVKSYLPELAELTKKVAVRVMVDHPDHIKLLSSHGGRWSVFIKIDGGDHRAGIAHTSNSLREILAAIYNAPNVDLFGFYSHAGTSYAAKDVTEAAKFLLNEFTVTVEAAKLVSSPVCISVGATPTAHSVSAFKTFQSSLPKNASFEIHAGNYPILDIQQLATGLIVAEDIAMTLLVEVVSVYDERNEACINAGVIALGREAGPLPGFGRVKSHVEWHVGKVSQEHGILQSKGSSTSPETFTIGDKIEIEPQHACITAGGHRHFFIDDGTGTIEDVWYPWRGW